MRLDIFWSRKGLLILVLIFLINFVAGYIIFYSYTMANNLASMENNLMALDLTRSILLYLLDNLIIIAVILLPLILIFLVRSIAKVRRLSKGILSIVLIVILLISIVPVSTIEGKEASLQEGEKPLAKIVFLITFDGARYDKFWKYADFIIKHKNESTWAEKIVVSYPTITYPNHISLFTGTWPQIHGTQNNPARAGFGSRSYASSLLRKYSPPKVEDIFKIASRWGYRTAIFSAPSTMASIIGSSDTDRITGYESVEMMDQVLSYLEDHLADIRSRGLLAFIHLVDTDEAMHTYGVDSLEYASAMERNAEQVGRLYNELHRLGLADESVIIVTADHGAIERSHYNIWPPLVSYVALWMWGKPFKKGYKLGGGRIVDIAPTICYILGIPKPKKSVGIVLYSSLNATYIKNIRGVELDLNSLEREEIRRAYNMLLADLVIWFLIDLVLIWAIILATLYTLLSFKKYKKLKKV